MFVQKFKFIVMKMHKNCCHYRAAPFGNRYMHQIVCRLGLCPRPHWGSLHRFLDPIAGLGVGPTGNGKEGEEEREGKGWEGGGRPGMHKSRVGKPS